MTVYNSGAEILSRSIASVYSLYIVLVKQKSADLHSICKVECHCPTIWRSASRRTDGNGNVIRVKKKKKGTAKRKKKEKQNILELSFTVVSAMGKTVYPL